MGYLDTAYPRILAHRGLATDAPENTLLAFRRALDAGATHLETDVHASSDGVAIISHDPDLERLLGRPVRIGDLSAAEATAVELGAGQRLCTLAQALDAFPGARFNIDVKDARAVAGTAAAVLEADAVDRVLITSFSERRRAATAAMLPGVAGSATATTVLRIVIAAAFGSRRGVARALRGLIGIQVPERQYGMRIVSPRVIDAVHSAGGEVHVWTVNDPADMRRLLDLGVDGLVTDRTDLAVGVVSAG